MFARWYTCVVVREARIRYGLYSLNEYRFVSVELGPDFNIWNPSIIIEGSSKTHFYRNFKKRCESNVLFPGKYYLI